MKKLKNRRYSKNKGITLISLIVTIIVLIILAGISVAVLTGDNGLINKAGEAKDSSERADEKEALDQAVVEAMGKNKRGDLDIDTLKDTITNNIKNIEIQAKTDSSLTVKFTKTGNIYDIDGEGEVAKGMATVTTPPTTAVAENTKYNDGEDTAVIPKDYKVVQEGETKPTIEDGLVVKDSKENEWVWIPVDNVNNMITTSGAPYTLCGTSGDTSVTASMASKSGIINDKNGNALARTTPGTTSSPYYREPDLVVGNGTQYDYANYGTAGFSSLVDMAQNLVKDYEEMIASVGKYGGFYVGRYELTGSVDNPKEVSNTVLTNQNWYNLYKACKGFTTNEVESRMIWGCQWDMVCKYILEHGEKKSITNSSTWGNYINNTETGHGSKQITGYKESWSANKIYDIAGNCWELTQEAYYTGTRTYRRRLL